MGAQRFLPNQPNWDSYYDMAEQYAERQFLQIQSLLGEHFFRDSDMSIILDFACGRGRMAEQFYRYAKEIICCDANEEALLFCRKRFSSIKDHKFNYVISEIDKINLPDAAISFIYSWDSMVHFEIDLIETYVKEFYRLLKPKGRGFIHHSNYKTMPGAVENPWQVNPHARAYTTANDVRAIFERNQFIVLNQQDIVWGNKNHPKGEVWDSIIAFQKE